jgi:hypothetical protein
MKSFLEILEIDKIQEKINAEYRRVIKEGEDKSFHQIFNEFSNREILLECSTNPRSPQTQRNLDESRGNNLVWEWMQEDLASEKIREALRKPNLYWIENFAKELYDNPRNSQAIYDKYKVDILRTNIEDPNKFIQSAEYNDDTTRYSIYLGQNSLVDIVKGNKKNRFIEELYLLLSHESTHDQQNQLNSKYQPYTKPPTDPNDEEGKKKYFSQKIEVDAYARAVAFEIYEKVTKLNNDIMKVILDEEPILNLSDFSKIAINNYKTIGGETFHRFLKQAYSYFNSPYISGGLAEYHAWLAAHKN